MIRIEDLWKSYRNRAAGARTVRGVLSRRMPLLAGGERTWALRGVGFEVAAGETVGLIGPNGAGKSTLMRLAAGLGAPDRGELRLPAATTAVLSLGDTVDPSLTGRENAVTAAIVAGLSRREAKARIAAALEFAELEEFADAPVRTYSEGMKLRLAFGVVAQLEPRALLVDEVLSVGDLRFQARCAARIEELTERGTAVLITSHYLEEIAARCDRAIWLQGGAVRQAGEVGEVIASYTEAMRSETFERTPHPTGEGGGELRLRTNRFGSQEVTVTSVAVVGEGGAAVEEATSGAPLSLEIGLRSDRDVATEVIVAAAVRRASDGVVCIDANSEQAGLRVSLGGGDALTVTVAIDRLDLVPGSYRIDVGAYQAGWEFAYDYHWAAYPLLVRGRGGGDGVLLPRTSWSLGGGVPGAKRAVKPTTPLRDGEDPDRGP